ncbi:phage GP46 family protein [Candidatus Pacearchaeota archaeon]|nr:phage GP46 family protein [Candidatus Pacearchaeota archaeon]
MAQQGDVLLSQTDDNGEIIVTGGIVEMTGGFETAAYLSLFGGNEDDDGSQDNALTWWANLNEVDPVSRYVSETQNLLQALAATSSNLLRIEEAAKRDLQWFLDKNIASSIEVEATIPGINRLQIVVTIEAIGEESQFTFVENWRAMA